MNVNYGDTIIFKTLAGGYHSLAIGKVSEYCFCDHLEVENPEVFYTFTELDMLLFCPYRVGYSSIKKIVNEKYLKNTSSILEDYPELLV